MDAPRLKDKYTLAKCCRPASSDAIVGYFSYDDIIKVHRRDCSNLGKAEPQRLIDLEWNEVVADTQEPPDTDYYQLDAIDFEVLKHHREYDIDYSLMVAKMLRIPRQEAFQRHDKLRNLGLLERVDAVMVRYRKNIAPGKWIKHRNHTYYRLTHKGARYLDFSRSHDRE
jgi:hypothetical protein